MDLTQNPGAAYGRRHRHTAELNFPAPGKTVVTRTDEDDETRAYFLLWLRAKRIMLSGIEPDDMTAAQAAVLRDWMSHHQTQRLIDAHDAEIEAALTGTRVMLH